MGVPIAANPEITTAGICSLMQTKGWQKALNRYEGRMRLINHWDENAPDNAAFLAAAKKSLNDMVESAFANISTEEREILKDSVKTVVAKRIEAAKARLSGLNLSNISTLSKAITINLFAREEHMQKARNIEKEVLNGAAVTEELQSLYEQEIAAANRNEAIRSKCAAIRNRAIERNHALAASRGPEGLAAYEYLHE